MRKYRQIEPGFNFYCQPSFLVASQHQATPMRIPQETHSARLGDSDCSVLKLSSSCTRTASQFEPGLNAFSHTKSFHNRTQDQRRCVWQHLKNNGLRTDEDSFHYRIKDVISDQQLLIHIYCWVSPSLEISHRGRSPCPGARS